MHWLDAVFGYMQEDPRKITLLHSCRSAAIAVLRFMRRLVVRNVAGFLWFSRNSTDFACSLNNNIYMIIFEISQDSVMVTKV